MRARWIVVPVALTVLGLLATDLLSQKDGTDGPEPRVVAGPANVNSQWKQLVLRGMSQSRSRAAGRSWPFTALIAGPQMPPSTRRDISRTLGGGYALQLRFAQSQYAQTTAGVPLWVIRGAHVICIARATKVAVACSTTVDAMRHGLTLEVYKIGPRPNRRPEHFLALGIAPDWATAVQVNTRDLGSRVIPVVGNTFSLRARHPILVKHLIH
jgi:hypothetical protein